VPDSRIEALIDRILDRIEDRRVIPIVGDELINVEDDGGAVPLYTYVARRLAERLEIDRDVLSPHAGLSEVAYHFVGKGGVPEEIHPNVRPILDRARFRPPEPLRQLAAIDRFDLFISLTFDSLLKTAIDEVRFGGENRTLEVASSQNFVPDLPVPRKDLQGPVVYHLLGRLSSQPEYVVTEEDALEFVHDMQGKLRLAKNLFDALRDNDLLFIGCKLSDWLARFLIRITKDRPLSQRPTEMEVIVGNSVESDASLVKFLSHFRKRTRVVSYPPQEFVAALEEGYRARAAAREPEPRPIAGSATQTVATEGAIFISYDHADAAAAHRLRDFLQNAARVDVWLDSYDIDGGERWDFKIRRNIGSCSYFMPLISANAVGRREGYFRREWRLASERSENFDDSESFILPVVIDDTPVHSEGVPARFSEFQWMEAPGGEGTEALLQRVVKLFRDFQRRPHR
jgi:hypothetical protein